MFSFSSHSSTHAVRTEAFFSSPASNTPLDVQWRHWASQGGYAEQRQVALERLQDCMRTGATTLDLSELHLQSLPDALPDHIIELNVRKNALTRLPDALPVGLTDLDVSDNEGLQLTRIPDGLRKLVAENNKMTRLPHLPYSLEVCNVWNNELRELPTLPHFLCVLEAGKNKLRQLPPLPPALKYCDVPGNKLTRLPVLPYTLKELMVHSNRLSSLPTLPHGLVKLDVSVNALKALPSLPDQLENLMASANNLKTFGPLPASLRILDISDNRLTTLSRPNLEHLRDIRTLYRDDNPWDANILEQLPPSTPPRAQVTTEPAINPSSSGEGKVRKLEDAVLQWYSPDDDDEQIIQAWSDLQNTDRDVNAFAAFLDRLHDVKFVRRTPDFDGVVSAWLTMLSKNPELRQTSFAHAYDSTQSCEDRVALTWNKMQRAVLAHAVSQATVETPREQLVQWSKEVFALDLLEKIAADKVDKLLIEGAPVDEVEVHLAYPTMLAERLDLRTQVKSMRFGSISGVDKRDLQAAFRHVSDAMNGPRFHEWLNSWKPWQSNLERLFPEQFARADDYRVEITTDYAVLEKLIDEIMVLTDKNYDEACLIATEHINDKAFAPLTRKVLGHSRFLSMSTEPFQIPRPKIG